MRQLEASDWLDRISLLIGVLFFVLVALYIIKKRTWDVSISWVSWIAGKGDRVAPASATVTNVVTATYQEATLTTTETPIIERITSVATAVAATITETVSELSIPPAAIKDELWATFTFGQLTRLHSKKLLDIVEHDAVQWWDMYSRYSFSNVMHVCLLVFAVNRFTIALIVLTEVDNVLWSKFTQTESTIVSEPTTIPQLQRASSAVMSTDMHTRSLSPEFLRWCLWAMVRGHAHQGCTRNMWKRCCAKMRGQEHFTWQRWNRLGPLETQATHTHWLLASSLLSSLHSNSLLYHTHSLFLNRYPLCRNSRPLRARRWHGTAALTIPGLSSILKVSGGDPS